jgi:acyl carrier protein
MDTIRQELRTFIIGNFMFGQGGDSLTDAQSFLETGVIDSTGVLELIAFLEQQYGITVEDNEVLPANLDSIDQIVAFVQRKQVAQGARVAG